MWRRLRSRNAAFGRVGWRRHFRYLRFADPPALSDDLTRFALQPLVGGCGRRRRQCLLKVREDAGGQVGRRHRTAKIKPLRLFAVGTFEEGRLFGGLDALDGHMHVQLAPQGDDRLDDCLGVTRRAVEALHEGAIDLDLVERESPQITQAGISSAEIVHDDRHAEFLERPQFGHDGFAVTQKQGLGDLQLKAGRLQIGLLQRGRYSSAYAAGEKLGRGKVDRHRQVFRPAGRRSAGFAQHPFADFADKPHFLRYWNKLQWRDECPIRLWQAYQRFKTKQAPVRHLEDRLIMQFKDVLEDGIADNGFELDPAFQFGIHFRQKEPDAIAAVGFSFIDREIRAFQQPLGRVAIGRCERDADAHGGEPFVLLHPHRFGEGGTEPAREFLGLLPALDVGLNQYELVAAQSRQYVIAADDGLKAPGDDLQQKVPAIVAKSIVNFLEMVEVDEMHGEVAALLRRSREEDSHSVDQGGAICQASQHVMVGEETDAPLGVLLLSGAPVPGDGRDAERQSHQRAERRRRQPELLEKYPARFGFVNEGCDDGDRPLIDDDGNVGPSKKPRQVGRIGLLHIDDRLPAFDCARRVGAEFRYIDERDFVALRYKLRISLAIENFVAKDRPGISRRPKKQHGGGRWLFAGGDLLEVGRADAQVLRPVARRHGRILIKQVIDRDFDGRPCAGDQDAEHNDKD